MIQSSEIQSLPGTYALILRAASEQSIPIGKLGLLQVQPGFYVYVGSAFGPGGLRARVGRHLRASDVRRWHIDYLKPAAAIIEVWFSYHPISLEHTWAGAFHRSPSAAIPLPGFGSSDCHCPTHLFYFTPDSFPDPLPQSIHFLNQENVLRIR